MEIRISTGEDYQHCLHTSTHLSSEIWERLSTQAQLDDKGKLAMAALNVCLSHREAILELLRLDARTSAMALGRSLLESYVVGVWIYQIADTALLRRWTEHRHEFSFESAAQKLRKKHEHGEIFEHLRLHYRTFNDYTHGGIRQLSRWIQPTSVEPVYSDGEMVELLNIVNIVGLLACYERELVAAKPVEWVADLIVRVRAGTFCAESTVFDGCNFVPAVKT
jgi:hypothetical protein